MAHAQETVTIDRPVQVVFDFVLNGMNNPLWRTSVVDIERLADTPGGPSFKQGLRGPTGQRIDGDYKVVESQPGQLIRFQVTAGPAQPSGSYTFEAIGDQTRVTFALEYHPKGLAKLMDGLITRTMQAEVATLHNLKTFLESQNQVLYEQRFG